MAASSACIIGLGASTAVGRSVWASAAAARAGVCGFAEHPFMVDGVGEPMRVARAPWLDAAQNGAGRYSALLEPAIDEALEFVRNRAALSRWRIGLAMALPPMRPGRAPDLDAQISRALSERHPGLFARVVSFESGHAAGHLALDAAMRSLAASSIHACIVAGVDSYLAPEALEWVEASDQLHGAGASNNAWGFIPGEAAGALLVTTRHGAAQVETGILAELVAVGLGREEHLIKTDSVCIGEGLSAAFRSALAPLPAGERIDDVYCDLNGETYRADEYGFTAVRLKERFRAATDFTAPADIWGDVGAAGAPLHVALAVIACRKRYAHGPRALVWASSESGERGAAIVRVGEPGAS